MKESPLLWVAVAALVAVGLDHGGGEVLGDAVDHDLHGAQVEAVRESQRFGLGTQCDHGVDLFQALVALPPLGAADADLQVSGGDQAEVGVLGVGDADSRTDHGILPAGDALGNQLVLGAGESGNKKFGGGGGCVFFDQAHGALVQGACRRSVGQALDASVGGVRGVGVDAGGAEGSAVGPHGVVIAAGQGDRAVGHHGVDERGQRCAALVVVHGPTGALDPCDVGVGFGVGGDEGHRFLGVVGLGQVALEQLGAATGRVDVRVLESGCQQRTVEVDDFGVGAEVCLKLTLRHDCQDAAVANKHCLSRDWFTGTGKNTAPVECDFRELLHL